MSRPSTPCKDLFRDLEDIQVEYVVRDGRFPEEKNIEVLLVSDGVQRRLLVLKVFYGRQPYYRRWVEVFSVSRELALGSKVFRFIGSEYEEKLINCLSEFLGGGDRLYIEYTYDYETRKALELGVPPPLTRLGYILFKKGFTWFKDWYYPEGFMEGGPKLQVEKPLDEKSRKRQLENICREVRESISRIRGLADLDEHREVAIGVLKRLENVLSVCGEP